MIELKCKKCGHEETVAHGVGGGKMPCKCGAVDWKVLNDGQVTCPDCKHRYNPGTWCCGRLL